MKRFAKALAATLILSVVFNLFAVFVFPLGSATALTASVGVQAVSAGGQHTLALKYDGTLWAWGNNYAGQLGDGTTEHRSKPVKVLDRVKAISAGVRHSMAIRQDNSLWVWGSNADGRLGDGTANDRSKPIKVLDGVKAISAGAYHSMAIRLDDSLWAWGDNYHGQLGDGTTNDRSKPVKVLTGVKAVSAGYRHSMALKLDNSLWTWGNNVDGKLGDGTFINRSTPAKVLTGIKAISAGAHHSMAIRQDDSLWAWGDNYYGQIGNGTSMDDRTVPVKVLTSVKAVSAGYGYSMAVKQDNGLWAWGYNYYGQVGDGTKSNRSTPVKVLTDVKSVSAGDEHAVAVKTYNSLWAWGNNDYGQLGDGTTTARSKPVYVMQGGPPPVRIALTAKTAGGAALVNNGITREAVTVSITGTAVSKSAKRNGTAIAWPSNGTFSADGLYALTARDAAGNTASLAFTIDKAKPAIAAKTTDGKAVASGSYQKLSVKVTVSDANLSSKWVKKNGTVISWPSTSTFSANGAYVVTAKDKAGNISSLAFIIDKTPPKITVKSTSGAVVPNNGTATGKAVVTVTDAALLRKTAAKDAKAFAWPAGSAFTIKGKYTITATDKAGNTTTYVFTVR